MWSLVRAWTKGKLSSTMYKWNVCNYISSQKLHDDVTIKPISPMHALKGCWELQSWLFWSAIWYSDNKTVYILCICYFCKNYDIKYIFLQQCILSLVVLFIYTPDLISILSVMITVMSWDNLQVPESRGYTLYIYIYIYIYIYRQAHRWSCNLKATLRFTSALMFPPRKNHEKSDNVLHHAFLHSLYFSCKRNQKVDFPFFLFMVL